MPFFVWKNVEALRRYAPGLVMVEGPNVEDARVKARFAFKVWMEENRDFWKDEPDFWNPPFEQFEKDIAVEPEIHQTYLVQGSE